MNIPKQVKIGCYVYDVLPFDEDIASMKGVYGEINYVDSVIQIDTSRQDSRQVETLLHEILHGIFDAYNIQPGDDEERVVTTMARGLFQVLRDNQEVANLFLPEIHWVEGELP